MAMITARKFAASNEDSNRLLIDNMFEIYPIVCISMNGAQEREKNFEKERSSKWWLIIYARLLVDNHMMLLMKINTIMLFAVTFFTSVKWLRREKKRLHGLRLLIDFQWKITSKQWSSWLNSNEHAQRSKFRSIIVMISGLVQCE